MIDAAATAASASSWTIKDVHVDDDQEYHGGQVRKTDAQNVIRSFETNWRAKSIALRALTRRRRYEDAIIKFSNERKIIKVLYNWLNSK